MIRAALQRLAEAVSRQSRRRKMQVLRPLIEQAGSILDVGSGPGNFLYTDLPRGWPGRIVAIDKRQRYLDELKQRFPFVETHAVDATSMPFADGEFDLVVCNAVLEHIPDIGDAVAREIRRVGKRYFVAVPYRHSVFEAHYYLPLLGYLSPAQLDWFVSRVLRRRLHNDPIALLTCCDMRRLFPQSKIVMVRAALGLFTSVVAMR
jgi:SAM-dependent methyltransferase